MKKQKIVVMGGSFNPPTIAHKKLLQAAVSHLDADGGIFVPSSEAYVARKMAKLSTHNHIYSQTERLKMLTLMTEDHLTVNCCEYGDDGHGHTYDTLCEIQSRYPDAEIIFILGADKLSILPKWRNHDDLLHKFHFAVVERSKDNASQNADERIQKNQKLNPFADKFIFIPVNDMGDVSSSKAREYIDNQEWGKLKEILTPEVMNYLKAEYNTVCEVKKTCLYISKKKAEWIQQILKTKPKSEAECFGENETYSVTAIFENNIEMDVKLCGVQYEEGDDNLPWTEAVLFDNGCEVCHTDVCDEFIGTWELEYDGISYEVTVKVED